MKDPANKLLKAYVDVLKDSIMYSGNVVYAGTAIPQKETEWVLIYIESMDPIKTEGKDLFSVIVSLQIVSMQDLLESDDTVVNDICEQVILLIDDKHSFSMTGFEIVGLRPMNFDRDSEKTETNHIITRKVQVLNYVQQN